MRVFNVCFLCGSAAQMTAGQTYHTAEKHNAKYANT